MARRQVPLESGELDRRITIQQRAEGLGSSGFPEPVWTDLATVYASKQDATATERFAANQQAAARFDSRWETPYRTDIDPDIVDVPKNRRVVYRGRTYDIVSASMIGMRQGVELMTIVSTNV